MNVGRILLASICMALVVPIVSRGDDAKQKQPAKKKSKRTGKSKSGGVDMSSVPPDKERESKTLADLGSGFKIKRTRHYSVLHDTGEEAVGAFATAIERTYGSCMKYASKLGVKVRKPEKKLIILYFSEHETYSGHSNKVGKGERPQSTPGVYFPDLNFGMFYNFQNQSSFKAARENAEKDIERMKAELRGATGAARKGIQDRIKQARAIANRSSVVGGDLSEGIVQHEVSHQVLWNIRFHNAKSFFANPRWFAEGTAQLFEPISTGSSSNIGRVNKDRLEGYQFLAEAGKLIPLREFISSPVYFGPTDVDRAYPQSWALVHYLNRVKKKKLKEYVEIINKRPEDYVTTPEQEVADFAKVFGDPDRLWERRWKKWMEKVR